MTPDGLAIHVGDVPEHVIVAPFGLDGLCAGFAVTCGPCHTTVAAYLTHLRTDPELLAREVDRHRHCHERLGGA